MPDLESADVIGRYADHAISIVGSISMFDELATSLEAQIVAQCSAQGVDVLLVLPYCLQSHVAARMLAREIERRWVPTASLTTFYKRARSVRPPRATFLDFPLRCPGGRPEVPHQQREMIRTSLEIGMSTTEIAAWQLSRLPRTWDGDGNRDWRIWWWTSSRADNMIRGTVLSDLSEHRDNVAAQERDFTMRCVC
jgi:D-proline reductase (dithiol) PrdB